MTTKDEIFKKLEEKERDIWGGVTQILGLCGHMGTAEGEIETEMIEEEIASAVSAYITLVKKTIRQLLLESGESFWFGINPINLLSPRIFPVSASIQLNCINPKASIFLRYKSDDENVHTAREDFDDNEEALKRDSQVCAIIMQRKEEK